MKMQQKTMLNPYQIYLDKKPIVVKGHIQVYDGGRKKIEIKKEIKSIFNILDEPSVYYEMEYDFNFNKLVERLKDIYEKTGQLPIFLNFKRELWVKRLLKWAIILLQLFLFLQLFSPSFVLLSRTFF